MPMTAPNPIALAGLDHIVLRSADPARLERFYVGALGCTVEKRQPAFHLTQLRAGDSLIDIVDARALKLAVPGATPAAARNLEHFCLRLKSWDAEAIAAHLRRHGIEPGEVRNRYGAEGEGPSLYFADPDGNTVELKSPAR